MAAVQQSGTALRFVPEELKTIEMCLAALRKTPYARNFIPARLKAEVNATLASRAATIANFKPRRSPYTTKAVPPSSAYTYRHRVHKELGRSKNLPDELVDVIASYGTNPDIPEGIHVPDPRLPENVKQHLQSFYESKRTSRTKARSRLAKVDELLPHDAMRRIQSYFGGRSRKGATKSRSRKKQK
jgi:hypothetical protein